MSDSSQTTKAKKLGILLGVGPKERSFKHGLELARAAQSQGTQTFLYLLDDAVTGAQDPDVISLVELGVKISGCAYALQKRQLEAPDSIVFGGLGLLNDIITRADRFVGLCHSDSC